MLDKYLILVNKQYPIEQAMPEQFEYDRINIVIPNKEVIESDIVISQDEERSIVSTFIEKETNSAFNQLKAFLLSRGIVVTINEAGRSIEKQQFFRDYYEKDLGNENADIRVAKPNESEHETGLAIDVGVDSVYVRNMKNSILKRKINNYIKPLMYKYIHKNAHKYGFIVRYAKDKQNITGYIYEPWHLRYVGKEYAKEIDKNNLSLEEYIAYKKYLESQKNHSSKIQSQEEFLHDYNKLNCIIDLFDDGFDYGKY